MQLKIFERILLIISSCHRVQMKKKLNKKRSKGRFSIIFTSLLVVTSADVRKHKHLIETIIKLISHSTNLDFILCDENIIIFK